MKKALIAIVLVVMAPFLLLVPVIGAASSVDGFFDPDSGEDFDVENYKTSDTVLKITSCGAMSIPWTQKVELFSQHNICRENYFLC